MTRPRLPFLLSGLALGACAATPALAAAAAPAAAEPTMIEQLIANFPRFFGRLHPVLVHFPIALLIVGVLFEFVAIVVKKERSKPSSAGLACVVIGALGAGAAAYAGWLNADIETHSKGVADTMEVHRWLGIGAAVFAILALVGGLIGMSGKSKAMTGLYRVTLVFAAALVGAAGHWGGSMVYGEGYLTTALFPEPEPEPVDTEILLAEAQEQLEEIEAGGVTLTVDFASQIMPIFERSCIECHGPDKSKGGFRLDSALHAMESRDLDEQVIIPGDAKASDLYRLVSLPHDDPDIMPPEGDGDPLSPEELELVATWINEGAHWFEASVVVTEPEPVVQAEVASPPSQDEAIVPSATQGQADVIDVTLTVDFASQIMPIFERSCIECHGPNKRKGGLRLDSALHAMESRDADEQVIIPGDAFASDLYFLVSLPHDDPDIMPPEGDGEPLTTEELALIETWINEGAYWLEASPVRAEQDASDEIESRTIVEAQRAPEPFVFDDNARATRDATLAALRERGAVAHQVSASEPWVEVRFDLLGGSVTDDDLAMLEPLAPTLLSLNLAGTGVTDEGVASLGAFTRLERLHLERTGVSDAAVEALLPVSGLRYLNLYATGVTDMSLVMAAEFASLERLYVWDTAVSPGAARLLTLMRPGLSVDAGQALAPAVFPDEAEPEADAAAVETETPPAAPASESEPQADAESDPTQPTIELASLPGCCRAAIARGEECDHACCVEAREKGEICATCAG